tara:strand:- start:14368 stop:18381 length:4014 start_codon:yes stop_codon:yes gene_type:complete
MDSKFYLHRNLSSDGKIYTESELAAISNYVVILAEPGGGKTELMSSLANKLGVEAVTATKFGYVGSKEKYNPLVIDAFDEFSKTGSSGIYTLLAKAAEINPSHVYLSSRSSEWDSAATNTFTDFLGHSPLIVRLCEFNNNEQRIIFDHHVLGEDFGLFQAEVARFDLETLLSNPQFLKLFADAYIESDRHFFDKKSIFVQAIKHLAKEANPSAARTNKQMPTAQKIDLSFDVFAKLLLSGSEGVSTNEATEGRMYPLLASLFSRGIEADSILATRLFKQGDFEGRHCPVHKIVAEYGAATHLIKCISDHSHPLTMQQCLVIIAPNYTVRDELRGLLGWMATLGNKSIQKKIIDLDPYAVLANGDPSQLDNSSKCLLIKQLKKIDSIDPNFRRGDFWRRFSVADFFSLEVIEEVKPLLSSRGDGDLRDLILELLVESSAAKMFRHELCQIVLDIYENISPRLLASKCLLIIPGYNYREILSILISEASYSSLDVSANSIVTLGLESFEREYLADFLRVCSGLYPSHENLYNSTIGSRYFIRHFIQNINLNTIEWLLDELTMELACVCGKEHYECDCRNGISKIIGLLLDRYFTLAIPPFDPVRVWQWIKNLNFYEGISKEESVAVRTLQDHTILRQGIIKHIFGELTDRDQIFDTKINKFDYHTHAGLVFCVEDYGFIVDFAFKFNKPELWAGFIPNHIFHRNSKGGPNDLRQRMRSQAYEKPMFMREWSKSIRADLKSKQQNKKLFIRRHRKIRRIKLAQDQVRISRIKYFQENKELIETGRHWESLFHFSSLLLNYPEKIGSETGNENLVQNALRNCLDFISPEVPTLQELASLKCASSSLYVEQILLAACLELYRFNKNLERVDPKLLKALRTNIASSYKGITKEESNLLKSEVDRLIFSNNHNAETFLRTYVEPQLSHIGFEYPDIWMLRHDKAFLDLRSSLSIEWLRRFGDLALSPLNELFEIAAQLGNRSELNEIISDRCEELMSDSLIYNKKFDIKRTFWLLRSYYFLDEAPDEYWEFLKADRDTIHLFYAQSERVMGNDHSYWPKLKSKKIEAILDAFVDEWPAVDLPSSWGTESPKEENAYRFLKKVIWSLNSDCSDQAIPVLLSLLDKKRFSTFHSDLKTILNLQTRKKALRDFEPPTPKDVVDRLDDDQVITVEGLRQLVIQELQDFQDALYGGEYNSANRFYEKGERLDENRSTEIIAERLNLRLEAQNISVTPEHQLKSAKRSDFTVTKMIGGKRKLLVTEVKGQWHRELYTAASAQLSDRYSIHPDAEQQGIYLVIWFGTNELVAGKKQTSITSALELKSKIETTLPSGLKGLIDVFVLDVSKT